MSLALFAGHVADRVERRGLLLKCVLGFLSISAGLWIVTIPSVQSRLSVGVTVALVYALVFWGGVVLLVTWALLTFVARPTPVPAPLVILQRRYASGEISREQYAEGRSGLAG